MKKTLIILTSVLLAAATSAEAQLLNASEAKKVAIEPNKVETPAAQPEITTTVTPVTQQAEEPQGIPVRVSEEEKVEIDNQLRESLRDVNKNDELTERVKFLESNNYADEVLLRRKMLKHGIDYKVAKTVAKEESKSKVNPKSDKDMNRYVFERADVPEKE